ncbi:Alkylated DNA repair protein alkB-like 8 [Symbiodinium microadriaticum]|uniref:Alkylated DNA repair protein alkB-like 8 n=1 Tax=Symbiodinium microadriaticum TaxID=2951 RepID=A0A1Q9DEK4_SYMMI|nr:Alkylated DNA repair protein alkB-like 8 [Symbiodinium microadriaticum]CAE7802109.1 alkbh8 [Symbiodinium microadriaticum]
MKPLLKQRSCDAELKGPEQKTTAVIVPETGSENPLRTPTLEVENVHKVYDAIASHWNHTRYKAWPKVEAFIRGLPRGSLVADLGCGNGKNLPHVKEAGCFPVASDISGPLAEIAAKEHGVCCMVSDCLCAPLRNGSFDAVLSIAVLHHLSTEPRRVQALREAARLLRPGGQLLVYCWSYEQDDQRSRSRHRFQAQDVLVPWSFRTPGVKKAAGGTSKGGRDETLLKDSAGGDEDGGSWEEKPPVCQRYCHVYREGELQELLEQLPELEVLESYFDTGNWCAVARKRDVRQLTSPDSSAFRQPE